MLGLTQFTCTIFIVVIVPILITILIVLPDILEQGLADQLTSRSIKRSRQGNRKCMPVRRLAPGISKNHAPLSEGRLKEIEMASQQRGDVLSKWGTE
jgi:hypothetical protein